MSRRMWLAVVACACVSAQAVTVAINKGTTYQTIDGFGTFCAIDVWTIKQGPFYIPVDLKATGWYSDIVNQMGATIMRTDIPCEFQATSGVYTITSDMRSKFNHLRQLRDEAAAAGEPFKVIASVWSPPGWMKSNNDCANGGSLLSSNFSAFGNHIVRFCRVARDTFGIDIFAVSPQNEPAFNEPYASCNYGSGTNYATMLHTVGPIVTGSGLGTKIFGCEHMAWAYPSWEDAIKADAVAAANIHFYAIHGYSDGIQADPESFDRISATEKPIWMTETCCYGSDFEWGGAFNLANTILRFVERGQLSAWVWWKLMGVTNPTYGTEWIISSTDGTRSPRYYTSAQIYRFIRPGMKKVQTTCSDNELTIGSFKDDSKGSMSIVIVNTGSASKSVTLNITGGSAPSQFEALRTTNGNYLVDVGPIAGNGTFTVPAQSITSLGYLHRGTPTAAVRRAEAVRATVAAGSATPAARLFDLRGRALPGSAGVTGRATRAGVVVAAGAGATAAMVGLR